eukprot:scaffold197903_cov34-Prasinocladus_malaysianus.AAC.1
MEVEQPETEEATTTSTGSEVVGSGDAEPTTGPEVTRPGFGELELRSDSKVLPAEAEDPEQIETAYASEPRQSRTVLATTNTEDEGERLMSTSEPTKSFRQISTIESPKGITEKSKQPVSDADNGTDDGCQPLSASMNEVRTDAVVGHGTALSVTERPGSSAGGPRPGTAAGLFRPGTAVGSSRDGARLIDSTAMLGSVAEESEGPLDNHPNNNDMTEVESTLNPDDSC